MSALFFCGAVKSALEPHAWPAPIAWGTVGALRDRILAGERPHVAILSEAALTPLAEAGLLATPPLPIGRTSSGLAIRDGAPRHPIATADELRAALLAATSIAWADASSGATAGQHFEHIIATLGIAEPMHAKATLVRFGVDAVAACSRGEVDLAVSQSSEITGRPGLSLLGPFPPPFALSTPYAAAVVTPGAVADDVMSRLASPDIRAALAAIGLSSG